jgi:nucleoside-diphosphate kinase
MERTFVMIKPDGVKRGLVGEVIGRFERKGLALTRIRMLEIDEDLARRHYAEHVDKPFFPDLMSFITSARDLMGTTDPMMAAPGTIRGDFGLAVTQNIVHGSDGPESASRELALFFG